MKINTPANNQQDSKMTDQMEVAVRSYEAGFSGFARWSKVEGTTKVVPSLYHVAQQMQHGDVDQFRAGWADARDIREGA